MFSWIYSNLLRKWNNSVLLNFWRRSKLRICWEYSGIGDTVTAAHHPVTQPALDVVFFDFGSTPVYPAFQSQISTNPGLTLNKTYRVNSGFVLTIYSWNLNKLTH